jgi:NO-binding membrane sensor protein with MHYT domain/nitrogen-specific signal transduction histidine kinase
MTRGEAMTAHYSALVGTYDYVLVALSVVIAIMAAYAALDLARRVTFARGRARILWLTGGAIAMGFGIWSMHYMGMLAFHLPVPVQYDWPTVVLSLVAAIGASAVALIVVSRPRMSTTQALLGSVLMGGGIAAMHYIGMAAMRMPAMCSYSAGVVALSVVLAIVISLVALWLTFRFRGDRTSLSWRKSASAVVMGLAIPVMHYTGMAAVTMTPSGTAHDDLSHAISVSSLGVAGIGLVTFVVLGAVFLTNLRFDSLPTARQLAARYFLSLAVISIIAILGALLVEYQGSGEIKNQLLLALLLSVLGVLLIQGVVVLRPALANIQQGISQLELAQQALQRNGAELARSNAELEQFAYVASHDLQEPLRMVASYTQLLARRYRGKIDSEADEFIGFAVDGATRMQTLIRDLLSYSRVMTQGHSLQPADAKLACDVACRNLQKSIEESGAKVTVGVLPTVHADATQLTQLFQNLIGNALKYCDGHAPLIRVDATAAGETWQFSVRDNGIGIESQYFERIFQMFQRLHTREKYSGTGIGLAICRRIVERHGGRIWVESQPAMGSTFHFAIPRTRVGHA